MTVEKRQIIYGSALYDSVWVIYGMNFYSTIGHSDLKVWFTCAAAAVLAAEAVMIITLSVFIPGTDPVL